MVDILIVEDNRELSGLMSAFLVREGYSVYCCDAGEEALCLIEQEQVRLVLLDLMLSGMDGFSFCSQVRKTQRVPIMVLSARVDKEAKLNSYLQGADDYIEKPVDIDVLTAKIKALFKRYYEVEENPAVLVSGNLKIDQDAMEVFLDGEKLNLTVKEYDLLLLLVENKDKTLSKEYLFRQIWGSDSFSEAQTLTVHIKRLRNKLEKDPKQPVRIKTVWGVGYRYEEI